MAEANNKDDKYGAGAGALESTSFWVALLRYGPSPQRHSIRSRMSLPPGRHYGDIPPFTFYHHIFRLSSVFLVFLRRASSFTRSLDLFLAVCVVVNVLS